MKRFSLTVAFLAAIFSIAGARPRLAVVISYDQMRGDYVERWSKHFSDKGFSLLKNEGAFFANTYFSHAKNITGPGHSVLMTGCNPVKTGITGNDFMDSACYCLRYCVADDSVRVYGVQSETGRSPKLLAVPTIGDVLSDKFPKSKTAAVALKDRAAILMAGAKAKTVLWFEPDAGGFTTSTYYKKPSWLETFNRRYNCKRYAGWQWQSLLPDGALDSVMYEAEFPGGGRTFPHRIPADATDKNFMDAFLDSPKSVELLFEAAKSTVVEEKLGADDQPDVLCIGVSTTDFIGHLYGPDSREIEELFVQCDAVLGSFIEFLDKRIGRENYVVVITADHGVAPIPEVARQYGTMPLDAGRIPTNTPTKAIKQRFDSLYGARISGASWVNFFEPPSIFLNEDALASAGVDLHEGAAEAIIAVRGVKDLAYTATLDELRSDKQPANWPPEYVRLLRNDLYPGRSGDLFVFPKQYWLFGSKMTTHGTFYDYDRFVPMMFFGGEINAQRIERRADPADIAPTLAALFGVSMKNVDGTAATDIIKPAMPLKAGKKRGK